MLSANYTATAPATLVIRYCSISITLSRGGTRDKLDEGIFPSIQWRDQGQLPKFGHLHEESWTFYKI